MLRSEEKHNTPVKLNAKILSVKPTSDSQEWIKSHQNINGQCFPISKKIYDLCCVKLNNASIALGNLEKERFFKEAEKLFAMVKQCELLAIECKARRISEVLLTQKCEDAYNALEMDSIASTQEIHEIKSVLGRLVKLSDVIAEKMNTSQASNKQAKAYYDLYSAGIHLYEESTLLAYDILKSSSQERASELATLNTSLDHATLIISDPVKNAHKIDRLKEDSLIAPDRSHHWAKFKALALCLLAAACVVGAIFSVGLLIPAVGLAIGASCAAGYSFSGATFLGSSAALFYQGFNKPVSNGLNKLADKAENVNKMRLG
jgi:hypothetical protein